MTWEGGLATVFITLTGGAFLTGLALFWGANDFEIGLLAAIPFLLQVVQLFGAYVVNHTGKRKTITVWCSVAGRQIWWLTLPLLLLSGSWRLKALMAIVILSNMAIMAGTAGWLSWMADLVPDRIRGRYFGRRNVSVALSTISATILGGIILDEFHRLGKEGIGFMVILGAGCIFALLAVILQNRVPDKKEDEIKTKTYFTNFIRPMRDKGFRHLLRVFISWNLAVGIAAPFFAAHMLSNLKMSFTQIALYSSLTALVAILLNRPWGILIDRFGCRPVVAVCAFGIAVIPLIWWIPRAAHFGIIYFEAIYSGALWAGFNLAAFNIPIANSPRHERTVYLAMFSVLTGLAFFVASLLGGILAHDWSNIHWPLGNQVVVNYHLLFALSSLLRFLAAFLVLTFREPREKGIPVLIDFMGYSMLKWLSLGRELFPHLLKRDRNNSDDDHENGAK
jgi:MFS family permease